MVLEPCFEKFPYLNDYQIYIDGNNVAYFRSRKNKKPILSDIILLINYLIEELGFSKENIHCICDPSLRYYIDKPIEYEVFVREGIIVEAPKVADEFILSFALKHEFCFIVSNDKFREYLDQLPSREWLEERRVSFMIIDDEICLSPNIDYEKIDILPLDDKGKNIEESNQKNTTLEVLERICKTEGEFDLF